MSWDLSSEEVICEKLENQQRTIFAFSKKIKELEAKLKVAVGALELIAEEYYGSSISMNEARMALEKIKGGE
jgi:hypothetical protein